MSLIGETLAEYHIEKLLGHGSMAEVYLGRHLSKGYQVAIKVIHPHLLNDAGFVERFKREAKVLSEMDHPHIIQVFDFITTPKTAYIVMEYLDGETLADRLKRYHDKKESMPLWEVMQVLEPIASAIDYAHEHGLVHRDIKPANILFRGKNDAVLTDFGLAFLMNDPRLSASNTITGTPAYLSPEQAKGLSGDARSDVYALGIVLYEMLSGYTPFQGNVISVVMKHISDNPPSLRSFGCYLPKRVEDVVMKALEKQPHNRYQSAQFFARDFRKAIEKTLPEAMIKPANPQGEPTIVDDSQAEEDVAKQVEVPEPIVAQEAESTTEVETHEETAITQQIPLEEIPTHTPIERKAEKAESIPFDKAKVPLKKKSSANNMVLPILLLLTILLGLSLFLFLVLPQLVNSSQGIQNNPEAGLPRYSIGQTMVISVPGGASTSVYQGCRSVFGGNVVGMASDGQRVQIKGRRTCGDKWFYQVFIKEAVSADWNGIGYISEDFLK